MRTRRVSTFAAPLVLVVACGAPAPVDDSEPPDARNYLIENPPAPCEFTAKGCEECLVHVAPTGAYTVCQQEVCFQDPSCCTTDWGEQCTRLAEGCDVTWRVSGKRFIGANDPAQCRFTRRSNSETVHQESRVELDDDGIAFADSIIGANGAREPPMPVWYRFRRRAN